METTDTTTHEAPAPYGTEASTPLSISPNATRFRNGRLFMGIGILLMALSFGINLLFYAEGKSFVTIMYVLTGIGAVLIFKALMDFFN